MATRVCGQRAEGAEPAHLQPGPVGPRRPSLAQRPEPRPFRAARALRAPSPRAPGKYPGPVSGSALRSQRNSEAPEPPKPESRPGEAPHSRAEHRLLPRARSAVASGPAPRPLPLSLPADWKRPRRAGAEDGRLPGDGGPGSAASCRGGGRAGAEGPPSWPGGRVSGRLPWRGRAGRSVPFRLVDGKESINHEDPGLPSPFPAGPQLGPCFCSGRLWRRRSPLHSLPLQPRSRPAPASQEEPQLPQTPKGPNLGQRACHPGPLRDPDAPGPGSTESAKPRASLVLLCPPAVRAAPALGGLASVEARAFSGLGVLGGGLDPGPSENKASGGAGHCAGIRAGAGCGVGTSKGWGGKLLRWEKKKKSQEPQPPAALAGFSALLRAREYLAGC